MDPNIVLTTLAAAIAALFGVLMALTKQYTSRLEKLYDNEVLEHKETRKTAAEEARENTAAINKLADSNAEILRLINDRLRRQDDWVGVERREGRRT